MLKTKNKKGELTTSQLVTIIVLIVSFVIILFLIFRLNLGATTDQEICHNSVVLSGQSKLASGPLDCKTSYICISGTGSGSCPDIVPTEKISVDSTKKNETLKILAERMAACWNTFGEGKINYGTGSAFSNKVCAVCSLTELNGAFSGQISYQEFYNYLRETNKSNSQTYLQYLYGTNTLSDFSTGFTIQNYLSNSLESGKTYFILTGISKSPVWGIFGNNQVPVTILEKTKANYDAVGCDEFLTKE